MTNHVRYDGIDFDVPEMLNFRGRRYMSGSSYSLNKDVARKWANNSNRIFPRFIVKSFKSRDKKKTLYYLFKKVLTEKEIHAYYRKVDKK